MIYVEQIRTRDILLSHDYIFMF